MIRRPIQEDYIKFISICAPNTEAPKYIKQTLTDIKGEMYSNITVVGAYIPHRHQWIDHPDRRSINTGFK